MVSLETASRSIIDQLSSPRISFSAEFLDDNNFISINPSEKDQELAKANQKEKTAARINAAAAADNFEFLSNNDTMSSHATMLTADELFFEGKLLPFWQMQQSEKLHKINLKTKEADQDEEEVKSASSNKEEQQPRVWFLDDDPSPRPPKCTVLWKELLRLKKQRAASSLSPSSSSSSSSSSLADIAAEEGSKESSKEKQNAGKRMKKGLERTRSATIRIRPMINVPICTSQLKSSSALPPLFPLKKGRLER